MRIGIMGSSGLIGTALIPFLEHPGHQIVRLGREFSCHDLNGLDAVINLAGAPITCRWTAANKKKIFESRIETTQKLFSLIRKMSKAPGIVINASAIGYYGDHGEATLDEKCGPGSGFLAEVAQGWEKACAVHDGARIVFARFGVVLSAQGGALAQMLTPFKLGLGGKLGDGKQFMSWVAIEDAIGAIYHILNDNTISGPVNIVSPNPVRNEEFTKDLGECLKRPTFFHLPKFIIKALLGQMGEELLLSSLKVEPRRLLETGYPFLYPRLKEALQFQLKIGPHGI